MNRPQKMALAVALVGALVAAAAVGLSFKPAQPKPFTVTLLDAGSSNGGRGLSMAAGQTETLTLGVNDQNISGRTSLTPLTNLGCQNLETAETGRVNMTPIAVSTSSQERLMQFFLTDSSIMGLPYPIDPLLIEGKPAAIIGQTTGHSLFSLDQATLRRQFAATADYMMLTADHHYGMPLGDGQLQCRFNVELRDENSGQSAGTSASEPFVITFGRGRPTGPNESDGSISDLKGWNTWVVDPSADVQLVQGPPDATATGMELADLRTMQARRTAAQLSSIRKWDDGSAVSPWVEVMLDAIVVDALRRQAADPPRISRALALVSVAMYDATVVAVRAMAKFERPAPCKMSPQVQPIGGCSDFSYPSEHAAVAGAAETVLAYLFPEQADRFQALVFQSDTAQLLAGTNYRSDIEAGLALGTRVGKEVIARGKADGSDHKWTGQILQGTDYWVPTPPGYQAAPLEPLAGMWLPWNIASGSQFRPEAPPRPGSAQFEADLRAVYDVSKPLSIDKQEIASFWEDKIGSVTPPGHWNLIALQLVRSKGLSTPQAALVFAALNTAQADAFIAAWDAKYTYWSVRPVTAIRRELDPNWSPYIYTPSFPSYVSGHATTSGAAAQVLSYFFPQNAASLQAWAEQAALSRLYGGIHFPTDNEVGLSVGRKVGSTAVTRIASIDWAQG